MLRVLTLATLFPDAGRPNFGAFVERQTLGLAALEGVELEVASPVRLPPWPLSLHPRFAARRALPERETRKGLAVHRPRFSALRNGAVAERMARTVLPIARGGGFDVIDAEFFWPDGVAAMHLAAALEIPFSVKARGSDIHFWGRRTGIRRQMLEAAERAGGLLAVSEALKRDMTALGMAEAKIRVHRTGADLDLFRPRDRAAAKRALGIEGTLLIAVGALIPLKGHRLAVEALAALPEATLLVVGDGPERRALERLAGRLGVTGRVRFLGAWPHSELPDLLGAADLLVHASEREGLANVWIEALACGTPVIAANVGGAPEAIDRPEAGRLVPRSAEAIAAAVRELLAHPPDPGAVRRAAERFSWARNAAELRDHLAALSAERH